MALKIDSHKKNALLKRDEYWVSMDHEGKATPKRAEMLDEIAGAIKAHKENIIVDKIFSKSGKAASSVRVLAYHNAADIPVAKMEKMKKRMGLAKKEEAA
jgi:ribosomal protein S24E